MSRSSTLPHEAHTRARTIRRALLAWFAIVIAETLHGILRLQFLVPLVGDLRARQLSVPTGCVLIFAITWSSIRWIGFRSTRGLLMLGGTWLALMLLFEIGLGRWVLGYPWTRILSDYDPRRGGLLALGMLVLAFSPLIAARLRGIAPARE